MVVSSFRAAGFSKAEALRATGASAFRERRCPIRLGAVAKPKGTSAFQLLPDPTNPVPCGTMIRIAVIARG
jgi:hypothetical protein